MGWDIDLRCAHCEQPLPVQTHAEGSIVLLGGTDEATVSITYNYSTYFDFSSLKDIAAISPDRREPAIRSLGGRLSFSLRPLDFSTR
jgi:hypothetical protein